MGGSLGDQWLVLSIKSKKNSVLTKANADIVKFDINVLLSLNHQ